jgi:hypothetical protein
MISYVFVVLYMQFISVVCRLTGLGEVVDGSGL